MASNEPKVLVEFDPEELKWLADRLHEEWQRNWYSSFQVSKREHRNKPFDLARLCESATLGALGL
jgi:hypothetical protein